jgi:putative chitinase
VTAYTIGPRSLHKVWSHRTLAECEAWAPLLGAAMKRCGIVNEYACAHFVAQCAHESGEGLFLREIWGPTPAQRGYWRRRDLHGPGALWPGLGFLTRGAGLIQTTGRANFRRAAARLGISYARLLARCGSRRYAALMAAVWWSDHFPRDMRGWSAEAVTHTVNGGTNGLAERQAYTKRAMAVREYLTPRPA